MVKEERRRIERGECFKFIINFGLTKEKTFHEELGWKSMLVSRKKTKLERYA